MNRRMFGFCLLMASCSLVMAAKLLSIEVKEQGGSPSVLFTLDRAVAHRVFTLTNPNRVVIDFDDTNLAVNLNQIHLGPQLIKYIRSGRPDAHTLRLVFEVNHAVMTQTKLQQSASTQHRFSLNLTANTNTGNGQSPHIYARNDEPVPHYYDGPSSSNPSVGSRKIVKPPVIASNNSQKKLRDVIVVLDPGHGGKDPGASGPRRAVEKNVTLAIAQKLKQIIDRQPGMRAVLTRNGDYYIELRERLNIARKYNGDVFISIHADAFINQQSSGASVFALSQSGATSEAARWLAEKENYSELGGVNLSELDDQSGLVRTVLIDLSQTATIGASLHMGERVLRNLDRITNLHNRKVEQARFMVLKSPDIPSILIETGFISNPREESNLTSPRYQQQLTQAIFEGLKRYFWDYPPHGTRIEALAGTGNIHLVRPGESLPLIANRYHISVAALRSANHLAGSQIRAGQRLTIPVV